MYYTTQLTRISKWTIVSPSTRDFKVNEMFIAPSKKALSDVLIGSDLNNCSLMFHGFPFLLQESFVTSAVNSSATQFTVLHVF